jgi:hypothetical protein
MTQVYINELNHTDSTCIALTPAIAQDIHYALENHMDAGTECMVGAMEKQYLVDPSTLRPYLHKERYTFVDNVVYKDRVAIALTKYNSDAQRVAAVMTLQYNHNDQGIGWLTANPKPMDHLLVKD